MREPTPALQRPAQFEASASKKSAVWAWNPNHAGDYIRNLLIAAPIAGTLLTGGSLWLNMFGKV